MAGVASLSVRKILLVVLAVACGGISSSSEGQQHRKSATGAGDDASPGRAIPFELHNRHVYLRVSVNGSGPLSFILDTGAGTALSTERARALRLKPGGRGRANGTGEKAVEFRYVRRADFNIEGVEFPDRQIAVLPLNDAGSLEEREIDGLLGESFFERFVVEIDYAARVVRLYEPARYKYSGGGEVLPLERAGGGIFVRATVTPLNHAPATGWFQIDTGGAHALYLTRPFVEANNLLTPEQSKNTGTAQGVGSSKVVVGSVESLRIGGLVVGRPETIFSQAAAGFFASKDFIGSIGGAVLGGYKVVFDYSRRQMILEPYAR